MSLTEKQEAFCREYILNGGNSSEAYRKAYPTSVKWKDSAVHVEASKLLNNTKVLLRVEELKAENKKRFEVDVDQKKGWLIEVVERSLQHKEVFGPDGEPTGEYKFDAQSVIRAINELNKMDGDHAPTRNEHTGKDGKPIETVSKIGRINFFGVGNQKAKSE